MIDPQLAAMMTQTAYAYAPTGTDGYGKTSYATTPLTLLCHVIGRVQEFTNKNGETEVSTGYLILPDVYPGLSDAWELDIPAPDTATGRRRVNIIAVVTRYDEVGAHHQSLYFGARGGAGRSVSA